MMKSETKRTISLKDTVYKEIVERICSGQLTPDTIFTEGQMVEEFGVSKSPVREALIQLCHEEVLKSIPRAGYQVVQITAKNIRDLTELRMFLELSSLPRVLENLTEEKIRHLKELNNIRASGGEEKDIWTAWHNNVAFHLSLVEGAENLQVYKTLERALATYTRAYAQLFTVQKAVIAPKEDSLHDHVVWALENHELYTAHERLKQDILFMEDQILSTRLAH